MASNLTVFLGGGKKQLVKTTPAMILREVVNTVCVKQNYAEPESYGLKNGKNFLDLSLSIRYANIAPGAKLELAKAPKDKSAPTHVDLALQLESGERMIKSFAITTTLWDVLLDFERESKGALNLTRRTAVPVTTAKNIFSLQRIKKAIKPSEVYLLPVVILLEREYVSIPTLKATTLQLAGLLKGNSVFRVMMRYTDAGIADFLEDIERDSPQSINATQSTTGNSSSTSSTSISATTSTSSSSSRRESMPPPEKRQITRQFTSDKTSGEVDFFQSKEAFHIPGPKGIDTPEITSRGGGVDPQSRDVNMVSPGPGASGSIDLQRQTPVQDMSAAMVEHSQEMRQLREQQAQAAMTDRVKKLSKASDDSDRERFVRALPPGSYAEVTEEPDMMDTDIPILRTDSPSTTLPVQDDVVRQIARRVSQQLKDAQKRGDSTVDYQTLIAHEIEKEQKAGVLPSTPTGSRHNSIYKSKADDDAKPMLVSPPSRSSTVIEEKSDRNVKVFRPPTDSSTPLSNQIELPDDFYELSSQDVMKLMNSQKARREQEENRGFKTAAARAEEEKAKERRYPKTIIRIRFPDRVQIQATFRSQETIGDLRKWVASVCVGQGEKFDIYTTPPKKVLSDNKQTLYQAGLAPQSIVYFSWADSKLNANSPFINGEYLMKMQDLPIPGEESTQITNSAENEQLSSTLPLSAQGRTGSIPMLTQDDRRMSQRMSTDKPGSSGGLPKWMKLSKK
ncbi:Tether containing UBX domain for GLUT4 [Entomortierella beljakovae]|nr:Tether containing UBX domain for GLUT4 [Entomortierella beljakovae]